MNIILSALCMVSGLSMVFASIALINGQLLPSILGGFYEAVPSPMLRTLVGCFTLILAANYVIAKGYMFGGQAYGGPLYVVSVIGCMITMALLVDNLSWNWHLTGGVMVFCLGALWVVHGLSQG
ncbi:MAG: hypothetical protein CMF62_08685 [Magnetococcales bacterium]|jgi:hypothetical protein|nr:hypothetical protein [Magnetococcales bacterium]|tara:strand:- start:556138 stop:556509 length:372 start_codon:yes stop_codon:yes gene_type:complete